MNIIERICKLQSELNELIVRRDATQDILRNLKTGDVVYISGTYDDYFPQIIHEIDVNNCQIYVYEESLKKYTWLSHFYIEDGDKFIYV